MKIKIQYIGRRMNGPEIHHLFMYDGQKLFFSKTKWCRIGQWYGANKTKKSISKLNWPERATGPEPSTEKIEECEALDQAAASIEKERKLCKRLMRAPNIFTDLSAFRRAYESCPYGQRTYLVNSFITFLESSTK